MPHRACRLSIQVNYGVYADSVFLPRVARNACATRTVASGAPIPKPSEEASWSRQLPSSEAVYLGAEHYSEHTASRKPLMSETMPPTRCTCAAYAKRSGRVRLIRARVRVPSVPMRASRYSVSLSSQIVEDMNEALLQRHALCVRAGCRLST